MTVHMCTYQSKDLELLNRHFPAMHTVDFRNKGICRVLDLKPHTIGSWKYYLLTLSACVIIEESY